MPQITKMVMDMISTGSIGYTVTISQRVVDYVLANRIVMAYLANHGHVDLLLDGIDFLGSRHHVTC